MIPGKCRICGRTLDQTDGPLSADCGGDCWGCVGQWEMGFAPSLRKVRSEIRKGLRFADGSPKPPANAKPKFPDFVIPEMAADDPDKDFKPWTDARVEEKAKQPGGIGWMERVGVVTQEAAAELRKRFPEAQ